MLNIKSLTHILPLAIVLLGLVSYNFMSAQWTPAPSNPPNSNAAAPVNVSGIYQAKLGDLGAVRMRAGEYCDAAGGNCTTPGTPHVFVSIFGENKRCANDKWVSACGVNPGASWNYNVCYSRGHADTYKWKVSWNSTLKGYEELPLPGYSGGGSFPYYIDLVCSE